ncbi:unnamed protein product [Tetraodon nigroviridis]|uniref:(spotted green pufferfish) hypothetical protein n=1 Tax=Tetraodon nigroviridis TaxID=99883 RepID=Q4T2P2_TETNG|nr:unnamed protein product [Tetraodon nigroviridis]
MVFRIPLLILPGMDFRFRDVMKEAENPDNGWMNIQPPNQGAHFINARLMKAQSSLTEQNIKGAFVALRMLMKEQRLDSGRILGDDGWDRETLRVEAAGLVAVARNQYERMGGDVTMQCGSLEDEASVSWKVNGTDVKAQHRLEGPRLLLTQVSLGHNGLYSCFQNPHGERRDTIYLHVGSEWLPSRRPARLSAR